jgi:hypothetical protein
MTSYRPGSCTVTFPEIRVHAERKGRCPVCHRMVRRNTTFTATESPFNRAADGHVRSAAEIRAVLHTQATDWVPDFTHVYGCKPNRRKRDRP